jgi:Putative zinc-finger
MSPSCPSPQDLLRLLDGEATQNESAKLRAHLEGCASCRRHSDELARLIGDIAAPIAPAAGVDERVESLLRAVEAGVPPPRWQRQRPVAAWGGLVSVAAAAVLLMIVRLDTRPDGRFDARGGAPSGEISRRVGVSLYAPLARHVPLRKGARVPARTIFTAAYRNLDQAHDVHLLLFAVDARGDIHWLYPAFTDAHSDPAAVHLPFSVGETALPDSVALDHPALGRLRIFVVLARQPLHVSAVETLAGDRLQATALERRLPNTHVEELEVELTDGEEGAAR